MTLFQRIEAVPRLTDAPAGVDNTAAIAAVEAQVVALAALIGTPAA